MKSKGFTLLELMVVVTIVGVFIVAMGPVLHHAMDDARTTLCLNNQATITRALSQYVATWHMYPMNYRGYQAATRNRGLPARYALDGLSTFVGGPAGELQGVRDFTKFPRVYVCPSADKAAVYPTTPQSANYDWWFHASYWVNPAVRSNRGYGYDKLAGAPVNIGGSGVPGSNRDSLIRFYTVCRDAKDAKGAYIPHWKAVYMPRPETVGDIHNTVFCGDTNNVRETLADGTTDPNDYPGMWKIDPGDGVAYDCMGFERHSGMAVGYLDGHARKMVKPELNAGRFFLDNNSSGDFMMAPLSLPGCGGKSITTGGNAAHIIPTAAFQYPPFWHGQSVPE